MHHDAVKQADQSNLRLWKFCSYIILLAYFVSKCNHSTQQILGLKLVLASAKLLNLTQLKKTEFVKKEDNTKTKETNQK